MSTPFQLPSPYKAFPSPRDAHLWGLQQEPRASDLLDREIRALQNYKGPFHKVINAHLRNDRRRLRELERSPRMRAYRNRGMEADIEILKDLMADAAIDRPVVAWRGFNGEAPAAALLENVGLQPFLDAGFVSTTLDPAYAEDLADRSKPGAVILTVLLPARAPAIYLEHLDSLRQGGREKELLVRQGSIFRILHTQRDVEGVIRAVVELVVASSAIRIEGV